MLTNCYPKEVLNILSNGTQSSLTDMKLQTTGVMKLAFNPTTLDFITMFLIEMEYTQNAIKSSEELGSYASEISSNPLL